MGCLLRTTIGELRVTASYAQLVAELRSGEDGWIEVQEQDAVQTRHMIRRAAILGITEVFDDGAKGPVSARILG